MKEVILGGIQGLSEFLPISSSGHVSLFNQLTASMNKNFAFVIWTHLGTVGSILFYYRRNFFQLSQAFDKAALKPLVLIFSLSLAPAVLLGLGFRSQIEALFSNFLAVPCGFLVTACTLAATHYFFLRGPGGPSSAQEKDIWGALAKISYKQALYIGLAQCFAIIPGVSRSGMTISVALMLGLPFYQAAFFSFLISIPLILGGALLGFFLERPATLAPLQG